MATQTYYFGPSAQAARGSNFGSLLDAGFVAPTAANSTSGWTVANTITNAYCIFKYGTKQTSATFVAASPLAAATGPSNTNADSWRTGNFVRGSFASGTWTFTLNMRAPTTAGNQRGTPRMRVWASPSPTAATAVREITSGVVIGAETPAMALTTTNYGCNITWSAPAITLVDEYLFVQMEWNRQVVGSGATNDVVFRISSCSILTTNFTPSSYTIWTAPAANATNTTDASACLRNICGNDNGGTAISAGGNAVRVTFQANANFVFNTSHCSIGVATGAASPNTTTTPVELKFSGASGCAVALGDQITSDWAPLTFLSSDSLVVDIDHSATANNAGLQTNTAFIGLYSEAAFAGWNNATPAGMASVNQFVGVVQIEAWTTPPAPVTATATNITENPSQAASQAGLSMSVAALGNLLFTGSATQRPWFDGLYAINITVSTSSGLPASVSASIGGAIPPQVGYGAPSASATSSTGLILPRLSPQNLSASASAGVGASVPQVIITGAPAVSIAAARDVIPGFVSPAATATTVARSITPSPGISISSATGTATTGSTIQKPQAVPSPATATSVAQTVAVTKGLTFTNVFVTASVGAGIAKVTLGGVPYPWFDGIYALELPGSSIGITAITVAATATIGVIPQQVSYQSASASASASARAAVPTLVIGGLALPWFDGIYALALTPVGVPVATCSASAGAFTFSLSFQLPAASATSIALPFAQQKNIPATVASMTAGVGAITPTATIATSKSAWFDGIYALNLTIASAFGPATASASVPQFVPQHVVSAAVNSGVGSVTPTVQYAVTQGSASSTVGQIVPKDAVAVIFSGPWFMGMYALQIPVPAYVPVTAAASVGALTFLSAHVVNLSQVAIGATVGTVTEPLNQIVSAAVATSASRAITSTIPFGAQQLALTSSAATLSIMGSEVLSLSAVQLTASLGTISIGSASLISQGAASTTARNITSQVTNAIVEVLGTTAVGTIGLTATSLTTLSVQGTSGTGSILATVIPSISNAQSTAAIGAVVSGWIIDRVSASAGVGSLAYQLSAFAQTAPLTANAGIVTTSSIATGVTVGAGQAVSSAILGAMLPLIAFTVPSSLCTSAAGSVTPFLGKLIGQAAGTSAAVSLSSIITFTTPQALSTTAIGLFSPKEIFVVPSAGATTSTGIVTPAPFANVLEAAGAAIAGFFGSLQIIGANSTASIGSIIEKVGAATSQANAVSQAVAPFLPSIGGSVSPAVFTATATDFSPAIDTIGQASSEATAIFGDIVVNVEAIVSVGSQASATNLSFITGGVGTIALPQVEAIAGAAGPAPTIRTGVLAPWFDGLYALVINVSSTISAAIMSASAGAVYAAQIIKVAESTASVGAITEFDITYSILDQAAATTAAANVAFNIPLAVSIQADIGIVAPQISAGQPATAAMAIGVLTPSSSVSIIEAAGIASAQNVGVVSAQVALATSSIGSLIPSIGELAHQAFATSASRAIAPSLGAIPTSANAVTLIGAGVPKTAFAISSAVSTVAIRAVGAGPTPFALPALSSAISRQTQLATSMAVPASVNADVGNVFAQIIGTAVTASVTQATASSSVSDLIQGVVIAALAPAAVSIAQAPILMPSAQTTNAVATGAARDVALQAFKTTPSALSTAQAGLPAFALSYSPSGVQVTTVARQTLPVETFQVNQAIGTGSATTFVPGVVISANTALATSTARVTEIDRSVQVAAATSTVHVAGVTLTVTTALASAAGSAQVGDHKEAVDSFVTSATVETATGIFGVQIAAAVDLSVLAITSISTPEISSSFINQATIYSLAEALSNEIFVTLSVASAATALGAIILHYVPSIRQGTVSVTITLRGSVQTAISQRGRVRVLIT